MEIRKANYNDIAELTKIRTDLLKECAEDGINGIEQLLYDKTNTYFIENIPNGNFVSYIAIDNGQIVATSGLCFYSVPPSHSNISGMVAYIMNMYTKPEYRKRGLAMKLLDCVVNEAKARGCMNITLNASEMGKPIYKKYGFKDVDNDMVYTVS